ncbi:MAG: branched-chain amino acid ABC transporter permease [Pseudomonadales bacterium]|nr:branched-chain amino acid ABC transporter permease [Pseudomonadales bacterium]MDP6471161.1 branched-chain amino acid ABC transporter permease [Pseudomonadales bacterium]MDP6825652.1 branched-chain amino acid ABC transporter permease [Pseudomonadales bacterium]MDP6971621.1 branched-chain amino acid ABC transporter permease [Pseudomonadales bacterium]
MEVVQLLISGISQGCVYGLIALGFVLIYKATEMVNFAQGDLMMLGAFIALTFVDILGWSFFPSVLATLVAMAAIGVLLERLFLRPMIGEPHFAVLMLTIGLGFVLRALAGAIWGSESRALDAPYVGGVWRLGFADAWVIIPHESAAIVLGTLTLCLVLFAFFRFARLGIAMQAASQNQLAAYYVGIPVKRIYSLVWALSAAIAGVAGILMAPTKLVDPLVGFIGIKAFAAAIVGGFGSLPGAVLGGLLVGVAEQFAGRYLPSGFSDVMAYVLLLAMLIVRPEGLFATMQRKKV